MKKRWFILLLIVLIVVPVFADDDEDEDEEDIYWERPLKNSVSFDLVPMGHSMFMGGIGLGINFERYTGKYFGIRLDIDYLQSTNDYLSLDYYSDEYDMTIAHYFNVTTGLRLYPFGEEHRFLFFGVNGGIHYAQNVNEDYSITYDQILMAVFTLDMGMRFTMAKNHCFSLEPVLSLQYYPRQLKKIIQGSGDYAPPYLPVMSVPDLYLDIGFRIGFSF